MSCRHVDDKARRAHRKLLWLRVFEWCMGVAFGVWMGLEIQSGDYVIATAHGVIVALYIWLFCANFARARQ